MRVGVVHQYGLAGSGSCIYARCLATALAAQGHDVHVVSHEDRPDLYAFFTGAFEHALDGTRHPMPVHVHARHAGGQCVSHCVRMPFYPVAYPRTDMHADCPRFVSLTDEQISGHLARIEIVLERIIRDEGLEALIINHEVLVPAAARRLQARLAIPYVTVIHGSTIEYVLRCDDRYPPLAAEGLEGARAVIVLNEDVRRRVLEFVPRVSSRLVELPVGVNSSVFRPVAPERRRMEVQSLVHLLEERSDLHGMPRHVRAGLRAAGTCDSSVEDLDRISSHARAVREATALDPGLPRALADIDWERDRIVSFVGKLLVDKGVHVLLAAARRVLEEMPNTRFIIMGGGAFREGLEILLGALDALPAGLLRRQEGLDALATLARRLEPGCLGLEHLGPILGTSSKGIPLADRVVFTGYLPSSRLARLLALSHVNVVPSIIREAFPLVVLEAASCGAIPVGTRLGGLTCALDSVASATPGDLQPLHVDPSPERMVDELAECLLRVLSHAGDADRQARTAASLRDLALQEYSWEGLALRLMRVLQPVPDSLPTTETASP